jgi:hypothetical protein
MNTAQAARLRSTRADGLYMALGSAVKIAPKKESVYKTGGLMSLHASR